MSNPMILGYWNFRGYGESCRLLLEYSGCHYEDRQITRPSFADHEPWRKIRENFGLDFPNLPYLIDGERKISESMAIMKYLGRKLHLVPTSEDELIRGDMLEGVILEIRTVFYDTYFHGDENYKKYATNFKNSTFLPKAEKIVKFMGGRQWLVSDKLTYLDFLFYAQLSQQLCLHPKILDGLERLKKYMRDFEELPRIKEYLHSDLWLGKYPPYDPYIKKEFIVDDS